MGRKRKGGRKGGGSLPPLSLHLQASPHYTAADPNSCLQGCHRFRYDAVLLTRETDQDFAFTCKLWLEENLLLPCGGGNHPPAVELMANIRPESCAGSLEITPQYTQTVILLCTKGFETDALFKGAMNDLWPLKSQGLIKLIPLLAGFGTRELPPLCIPVWAAHNMRWENRDKAQFRDAMIKCLSRNLGEGLNLKRKCAAREESRIPKQQCQPIGQQSHLFQPLRNTPIQQQRYENQAHAETRCDLRQGEIPQTCETDSGLSSTFTATSDGQTLSYTDKSLSMTPDSFSGPHDLQRDDYRLSTSAKDNSYVHTEREMDKATSKDSSDADSSCQVAEGTVSIVADNGPGRGDDDQTPPEHQLTEKKTVSDIGLLCQPTANETARRAAEDGRALHLKDVIPKRSNSQGERAKARPSEHKRSNTTPSNQGRRRKSTEAIQLACSSPTLFGPESCRAVAVTKPHSVDAASPKKRTSVHKSCERMQERDESALQKEKLWRRRDGSPTPFYVNDCDKDRRVDEMVSSDECMDIGIIFCNADAEDMKSPDGHGHWDNKHTLTIDMEPMALQDCASKRQNDIVRDNGSKIREVHVNQRSGCKNVGALRESFKMHRKAETPQRPKTLSQARVPTKSAERLGSMKHGSNHRQRKRGDHNSPKKSSLVGSGRDSSSDDSPDCIDQVSSVIMHIDHVGILQLHHQDSVFNVHEQQTARVEKGSPVYPDTLSPGGSLPSEPHLTEHFYDECQGSAEEPYIFVNRPPALPAWGPPKAGTGAKQHKRRGLGDLNDSTVCKRKGKTTARRSIMSSLSSRLTALLCCIRRKKSEQK